MTARKTAKKAAPAPAPVSRVQKAVTKVSEAVEAAALIAQQVETLRNLFSRAARAPEHIVNMTGVRNGQDPVEVAKLVVAKMDEHGIE